MVMVEDGTPRTARRRIDESLRKQLEWSGSVVVSDYGERVACCPLCWGINTNEHGRFGFPSDDWGHRDDCDLAPGLGSGPSGKGGADVGQ